MVSKQMILKNRENKKEMRRKNAQVVRLDIEVYFITARNYKVIW
jgi:hypothetical protein